jgi:hypothetical protein
VFDRLEDASHARGKLAEGGLTATDPKLWKIELDVLGHQVRQIGAAGINPSEVLLSESYLPAVGFGGLHENSSSCPSRRDSMRAVSAGARAERIILVPGERTASCCAIESV